MASSIHSTKRSGRTNKLQMLASILPCTLILPALAQNADPVLEEIIVTAQKREERLQDVPVVVQAFDERALATAGILDVEQLPSLVPGLVVGRAAAGSGVYMRGIGSFNSAAGQEPPVATYVDGVYRQGMWATNMALKNIERVEVIKGPQGTLFGRNATGGLIHVITKDPSAETAGSLSLSAGNYDTYEGAFYGTTGITDNFAADLSLFVRDQGKGFGENTLSGKAASYRDEISARTKWQYSADKTKVTLALDYTEVEDPRGLNRNLQPGTVGQNGGLPHGDFHDVQHNVDTEVETDSKGVSLQVDHNFGGIELVSISSYREDRTDFYFDNDIGPIPILVADIFYYTDLFTQELRLSSTGDSGGQWMAGVFYLQSRAGNELNVLASPALVNVAALDGKVDTKSYSAFGEYRFPIGERGQLIAGVRYTLDERETSGHVNAGAIRLPDQEEDWSEPTWRLVYDFKPTENVMLFVSYNRGFKSGNFNITPANTPAYNPEIIDAYEAGVKSLLLNGRLKLNTSLFYYEYDDLQLLVVRDLFTETLNATGSEIRGLDVELELAATENLRLHASASWMDSGYTSYPNAADFVPPGVGQRCPGVTTGPIPLGGNCGVVTDVSGNQMVRAPDFTANIGGSYIFPTDFGYITATARLAYNEGFPWDPSGRVEEDSYTLLNMSVSWDAPDGRWGARVQGENLTDTEYSLYGGALGPGDYYSAANPRTYSVTIEYNF